MQRIRPHVTAIIVTFNRMSLLTKCLDAQATQEYQPDHVLVVDNASSDGTATMLTDWIWRGTGTFENLTLPSNTGGAGGFAEGIRVAINSDTEWMWMMDDDAEPHPDALAELLKVASDPSNIYGSLAVCGENTSWATSLADIQRVVHRVEDVPDLARVESIPLLGFLIHRSLVKKIGFPDAGFFIAADDIEYCVRARRAGAEIYIAGKSRIEHPKPQYSTMRVFGHEVVYLSLPPWKRYYDTRNRLLIARKYYGGNLFTQTIPGSFVRLIAAMYKEPRKLAQLRAWCCGMFDGLLGIKGKRHEKWGIHP